MNGPLALVRDKDSGHLPEIEELLKKDKRYLDMDVIPEDRKSILFTYMEVCTYDFARY